MVSLFFEKIRRSFHITFENIQNRRKIKMKIKEVVKRINVDLFADQKMWLAKQAAQHDSQQAKGLLNLLDMIQDAAEEELGMNFSLLPKTEEVTQYCSNCDREVTLHWNVQTDGLKSFCPHCGERLMLCEYCPARDKSGFRCDYDEVTDTCTYNQHEQNLNTLIGYLYRDASNYKVYNQAVIPGVLSDDEKQRIWKSLQAGEWFIPQLVGLPAKQYHGTEDDHPYFELQSIEETLDPVDTDISGTNLVTAFEKYANMWEQNLPFL